METGQYQHFSDLPEEEQLRLKKEAEKPLPRSPFEDVCNVVELTTDNANYKIVYSSHGRKNNPEDIEGSDAVVLEYIVDYSDEEKVNEIIKKEVEEERQYVEIVKKAALDNTPLYFVDLSPKTDNEKDKTGMIRALKKYAAPIIGLKIGYEFAKSAVSDMKAKPIDRRSFLKGLGKIVAAAYVSSPAIELVASLGSTKVTTHEPNENSEVRKFSRKMTDVNGVIHPELKHFSREGRNALIAEKAEYIAKTLGQKMGKKPKISLVMGALHTGLEDDLRMTETERVGELHKYFTAEEIGSEMGITRVDFRGSGNDLDMEVSFSKVE